MPQSPIAKSDARKSVFALLAISLFAAVLFSLWQRARLSFKAGHIDEYDYLFVAKTLLAGLEWPSHTYIFGSDLSWYLLGTGEALSGNLIGARGVAAALGLLSLFGVYLFNKELWQSSRVALLAALLMAISASHIFISRHASYDVVSFTFFSLAMMPLLRSSQLHRSSPLRSCYLLCGIFLLLAAVLTKYTTAAYLPLIWLLLLIVAPVYALVGGIIVALGLAVYLQAHWGELLVLYEVQINGTHGANTSYQNILYRSGYYLGSTLLLFATAIIHAISTNNQRKYYKKFVLLLLFACPLFLYHLHSQNLISLYKHLNFSLFFLVSGAAWLIGRMYLYYTSNSGSPSLKTRCVPAVIIVLLVSQTLLNNYQLKEIELGYPNMQGMLNYLKKQNNTAKTPILSENPYLFRYLAFDSIPQEQINETSWLDNNKDGVYSHQDVLDALWDKKFHTILLTDEIHPDHNAEYRKILTQRGYLVQYKQAYKLSSVMTNNLMGEITLYQLPGN